MSQPDKMERAANLFDLRRIIGGLFVAWGVLLVILGLVGMGDVENSTEINLFAGLAMLAFGILMLLWAFTRPLGEELEQASSAPGGDGEGAVGPGDAGRE
jgi:hypothetical protein